MNSNYKFLLITFVCLQLFFSCKTETSSSASDDLYINVDSENFPYMVEQFADLKILRYQLPGWENLTLDEQKLVYYLTQAGLSGRDIMWDQNYRYNLSIREALETIYTNFDGDKTTEEWNAFETYLKRVWFSNGIHHHYSNAKIKPEFSPKKLDLLFQISRG